jgi:hypothetical protein
MFDEVVHRDHIECFRRESALGKQRRVYDTIEFVPRLVREGSARFDAFRNETLFLCSRQKRSVSTTDIEKPRGTRSGLALFTADLQIVVEMAGDFVVDSLEVKVIAGILIGCIHSSDTFRVVSDIEENMGAPGTTGNTILTDLKEELGSIQATGAAALAPHAG